MKRYLVKTFDEQHRLVGRFIFTAPSDLEARSAVQDMGDARDQELWCGDRSVPLFAAAPEPFSPRTAWRKG